MLFSAQVLIKSQITKVGKLKKKMYLNMTKILSGKNNLSKKKVIIEMLFTINNMTGIQYQLMLQVYLILKNTHFQPM